jgi:hypothetical protein
MKPAHIQEEKRVNRHGLIALRRVIFFCLLWLSAGFAGWVLLSCSRTSAGANGQDAQGTALVGEKTPSGNESLQNVSENPSSGFRRHSRRNLEEVEAELERERVTKQELKEENDWLRVQLIQLQHELVIANQNIYSLSRKLDAIFKPN